MMSEENVVMSSPRSFSLLILPESESTSSGKSGVHGHFNVAKSGIAKGGQPLAGTRSVIPFPLLFRVGGWGMMNFNS
jgi:hypothetical protein